MMTTMASSIFSTLIGIVTWTTMVISTQSMAHCIAMMVRMPSTLILMVMGLRTTSIGMTTTTDSPISLIPTTEIVVSLILTSTMRSKPHSIQWGTLDCLTAVKMARHIRTIFPTIGTWSSGTTHSLRWCSITTDTMVQQTHRHQETFLNSTGSYSPGGPRLTVEMSGTSTAMATHSSTDWTSTKMLTAYRIGGIKTKETMG